MPGGELTQYQSGDDLAVSSEGNLTEGSADTAQDIREVVEGQRNDDARGLRRGTSIEQHRAKNGSAFDRRIGLPKSFSDKAAAHWANLPRVVKSEVRKIEASRDEWHEAAKSWAPLIPYAKLAANNGTDLATAMSKYNSLENLLYEDPVRGLTTICQLMNVDPIAMIRAWNVALSNPGWQQQAPRQQQRQVDPNVAAVNQMANDPRFPGMNQLRERMAQFLTSGHADTLQAAYYLAANERGKGTTAVARARAAAKATSGAPGSGSGHIPGVGGDPNQSRRDLIRAAIAAQRGEA
jgi:hypothetical protein